MNTPKLMHIIPTAQAKQYLEQNKANISRRMYYENVTDSTRGNIFTRYNITAGTIHAMVENGSLAIPVQDYNEAEQLRQEIFSTVLEGQSGFVYNIATNSTSVNVEELATNRAQMAKQALNSSDSEYIDGVTRNGFWPLEILESSLGENITLGFIDTNINLWNNAFAGLNVPNYLCNPTACWQIDFLDLAQKQTHGTRVAETALKFLPSTKNIECFSPSVTSYKHNDDDLQHNYILALEQAFIRVEEHLKALDARGKPYAYILNMSLRIDARINNLMLPLITHTGLFDTQAGISLYKRVRRLHQSYPRFQLFISGGNDDSLPLHILTQATEVMPVAGHTIDFHHFSHSNSGYNVLISTLARNVQTISGSAESGTSFSSPTMAAIAGIIMALIPDLKNYELRGILLKLSVPLDQFFAKNIKNTDFKLKTPVFIFDLRRFCQILNAKFRNRINPQILKTLNDKSNTYYLENLPQNNDIEYVIPNYGRDVRFNMLDKIAFAVTVTNSADTPKNVIFALSSGRIPPKGLSKFTNNFHVNYDPQNILLSFPGTITIPANFVGRVMVNIIRESENELEYSFKLGDTPWQTSQVFYQGLGDVPNVMLGLGCDEDVKITKLQHLSFVATATPNPTMLFSNQEYFDDVIAQFINDNQYNITNKDELMQVAAKENPKDEIPTIAELGLKEVGLSGLGVFLLFALYHLRKKMNVNLTPESKPKLNKPQSFPL